MHLFTFAIVRYDSTIARRVAIPLHPQKSSIDRIVKEISINLGNTDTAKMLTVRLDALLKCRMLNTNTQYA